MNKVKIIFDFDNTLAYRDGMWTATIHEILIENGYNAISKDMIEPLTCTGFPWHDYEIPHESFFKKSSWWEYMESNIKNIFIKLKVNESEADKFSRIFKDKYLNINKWHLFSDTINILNILQKNNYICYVLSNHVPELSEIVKGLQIDKFFKKVYNSADIGYEKPHYKIFQTLINDLDEKPSNLIMIGDNYISDVTGARSNGMNAILVRSVNINCYKYYSSGLIDIFGIIKVIESNIN